jgi:hypothetical protein
MGTETTGSPSGPHEPVGDLDGIHSKIGPEVLEKLSQPQPALRLPALWKSAGLRQDMGIPNDQPPSTDFGLKQEIEHLTRRRFPDVMLEVPDIDRPACDRSTQHRLGLAYDRNGPARGLLRIHFEAIGRVQPREQGN